MTAPGLYTLSSVLSWLYFLFLFPQKEIIMTLWWTWVSWSTWGRSMPLSYIHTVSRHVMHRILSLWAVTFAGLREWRDQILTHIVMIGVYTVHSVCEANIGLLLCVWDRASKKKWDGANYICCLFRWFSSRPSLSFPVLMLLSEEFPIIVSRQETFSLGF